MALEAAAEAAALEAAALEAAALEAAALAAAALEAAALAAAALALPAAALPVSASLKETATSAGGRAGGHGPLLISHGSPRSLVFGERRLGRSRSFYFLHP